MKEHEDALETTVNGYKSQLSAAAATMPDVATGVLNTAATACYQHIRTLRGAMTIRLARPQVTASCWEVQQLVGS